MELTPQAAVELRVRLDEVFERRGRLTDLELEGLDWPEEMPG